MRGSLYAGLILLLAAHALQAEQIYRWVDAEGGVHYSATPPPGQAAESEDLKFQRNPDPEQARERLEGYDKAVEKRRADAEQAAKDAGKREQEATARRRKCADAREIISRLETNPTVRFEREDGSFRRYTDQEREQRIAEARGAEREFCD